LTLRKVHLQFNICYELEDAAMMFPDTSNAQQSAALRQAAERSQAASNTEYEYAYATWNPTPPRRAAFTGLPPQARSLSAREDLSRSSR
jgi:hypothetical protein